MSHREKDDDYDDVVAGCDCTRVIVCKDNHQWIVQDKRGKEWRSLHYCTTRNGIFRRLSQRGLPTEGLSTLPERFESRPATGARSASAEIEATGR